jgi:uncharacterized protein (TIGR04255 family)
MKKKISTKRTKFENPPINELVIAIYFEPIIGLKAQHIGKYWDTICNRYPNCEQQAPLSFMGFPSEAPGEIFPLPRFWFHSGQGTPLVQVQRDAFIFNWRTDGKDKYPHYENVKKKFVVELTNYIEFVRNVIGYELKGVLRYELTYINVISENELWSGVSDVGKLFPPLSSLSSFHEESRKLVGLNCTSTYVLAENLFADSAVRFGKRIDTQQSAAILELKAYGAQGLSVEAALAWYDDAHDATYKMFLDFTDQTMQRTIWKPKDAR